MRTRPGWGSFTILVLGMFTASTLMVTLPIPALGQARGEVTGFPLPRFVSMRSAKANLRTGPGLRYPIDWVIQRRGLPVEIIGEFETWRQIRDKDGTEGWVHQSMLTGTRRVTVDGNIQTLRRAPTDGATAVARAEPGVIADLEACENGWCLIDVAGYEGWVPQNTLWGVYPGEAVP